MYLIEINCMLEILRRFTPGPEFLYFAISALTEKKKHSFCNQPFIFYIQI